MIISSGEQRLYHCTQDLRRECNPHLNGMVGGEGTPDQRTTEVPLTLPSPHRGEGSRFASKINPFVLNCEDDKKI
jgi:hypothetical protein